MRTRLTFLLLASALTSCTFMRPVCDSNVPAQPRCHEKDSLKWKASDGKKLPYIAEVPKQGTRIKAVVILVPGLDGTLCDYGSLTRSLVQHGYAVYGSENRTMAYDSWWRRGRAVKWQKWVDDLHEFTALVRAQQSDVPIYYHAHSFGAVVALESVIQCKADKAKIGLMPKGLILQSPAYVMLPESKNKLLSAALLPVRGIKINYLPIMAAKGLRLTRNENWNCAWMKSRNRVQGGYSIGWFQAVMHMGYQARLGSVQSGLPPTLALEGQQDRITLGVFNNKTNIATKQTEYETYLHEHLAGGHADMKQYPEGCHLLTEGDGKEVVIRDIIAWLDARP